jgi:hypothetical protein
MGKYGGYSGMIEIAAQLKNKALHPYSQEDADRLKEYGENQLLNVKITGPRKPRSIKQNGLVHSAFGFIAEHMRENAETDEHRALDNTEKVKRYIKFEIGFYDSWEVKNGVVVVQLRSVAFDKMSHVESLKWYKLFVEYMADMLGITPEVFIEEVKSRMKRN